MDQNVLQQLLKTLGGGPRLGILAHLKKRGSASVTGIAAAIHRSVPVTSLHLARLERTGVLKRIRRGLEVYYRISLAQNPIVRRILKEL